MGVGRVSKIFGNVGIPPLDPLKRRRSRTRYHAEIGRFIGQIVRDTRKNWASRVPPFEVTKVNGISTYL